jgi:hypothetical protein
VSPVRRAAATLAATALLASTLSACGGEDTSGQASERTDADGFSGAADLSTCQDEARRADPPYGDAFPQDWPFPAKTVVYNAEDRGADGTIVTGISSTPFKQILAFLNGQVADQGFEVEKGETEAHDAEAEWDGNGFRGRWAIRESAQCPGETVIQVLSTKE